VDKPATEPRLDAHQHDALLVLALGSLSLAQRFESLVNHTSAQGTPLDRHDPVVLAALGVVSLGRSLRRWLDEASPVREAPVAASPSVATPWELLR
jgi:hypothetical protein